MYGTKGSCVGASLLPGQQSRQGGDHGDGAGELHPPRRQQPRDRARQVQGTRYPLSTLPTGLRIRSIFARIRKIIIF